MHVVTDVQVFTATMTGVVILALQAANLWRLLANGRVLRSTRAEVTGLSDTSTEITEQLRAARASLEKIQALVDERSAAPASRPYGRRATDRPTTTPAAAAIAPAEAAIAPTPPASGLSWPF